jgi:hypothetical protein
MKTIHILPAILSIILFACNSKSTQQGEVDDPEYAPTESTTLKQSTMKGFTANIEKDAVENVNTCNLY